MTSRFVSIPADRLRAELDDVGAGVSAAGGSARWTRAGREEVFEFSPAGSPATVRVFTTLDGRAVVRDCGADAVRIAIVAEGKALVRARKILRTAPAGGDRVGKFLERFREALRRAFRDARSVRRCPACDRVMARRSGPRGEFLGCVGFPECRRTLPIP